MTPEQEAIKLIHDIHEIAIVTHDEAKALALMVVNRVVDCDYPKYSRAFEKELVAHIESL